ncbi:cyclohexanol dehydrogenase-like [Epargyreus clarus]|uniref:cyclohexanol dehydrogenase-like n=1 Tax=Epargyreus clarus TaxID=520877 RepID=UPI003C2DF185
MNFSTKVVVVTGAGSGMGAAIAENFAKLNASLCLIEINESNLRKVSEECEKLSKTKVLQVVADLGKDEDVKRSIDSALKEFGKIDVLVNCAGIHGTGRVTDPDIVEKYDRVLAVNLRSVVAMTNKAAPALIKSKGCVINISSIASRLPSQNTLPYNLSKAGVTHFTKCAALELAKDGVRVNCISPGPVKTNLLRNTDMTESEHDQFWHVIGQATPLKRVVKAEEIAELTAFLASDKANSITGSDYVMDSGLMIGGSADAPAISSKAK